MASEGNSKKYPDDQYFYYDLFEKIGCSKFLAEKRTQIYHKAEICSGASLQSWTQDDHTDVAIVGSRGGVGLCLDSDFDILFIQSCIKCFKGCPRFVGETPFSATFELDFENVPSGYAKLRLVALYRDCLFGLDVRNALVQKNGSYYLCNLSDNMFSSSYHSVVRNNSLYTQQSVFADVTGPAISFKLELPNLMTLYYDHVQAIPCAFPSLVDAWCSRERRHNWPHADLIETIKALDVLVVPTGVSDSLEEGLQWRLSLTLAERALVRSFNDIQLKLFAAMKMLVKHEVKPFCTNITSYIVKNIVFWVFEGRQLNYTKASFIDNLQHLLHYLKKCVHWRYLPNYMIPAKNMFESKISIKEKIKLLKHLNILIDDGPHVLLRCPLVREMFEWPSSEFQRKIVFRDLVEQVCLSTVSIPPADYVVILGIIKRNLRKKFHREQMDLKVKLVRLVFNYIIPLVRRTNPCGFFTHLVSMTNDQICTRLLEGVRRGYLKT